MNIDSLHLTAFALESSGASAMAIGSVHTLTLKPGHSVPPDWPFAGRAVIGPAPARQRSEAAPTGIGLTLTFKIPISA
ncbi:MAG: hypothetical protein EON92_04805 [Burkholderiales bacterium]|nr:MAG: hypothetical protein EON92_04805 [Burkholderiales bacterium]